MSIREYLNYSMDEERKKAERNDEENSMLTVNNRWNNWRKTKKIGNYCYNQ